jgi:hypothetical protein
MCNIKNKNVVNFILCFSSNVRGRIFVPTDVLFFSSAVERYNNAYFSFSCLAIFPNNVTDPEHWTRFLNFPIRNSNTYIKR